MLPRGYMTGEWCGSQGHGKDLVSMTQRDSSKIRTRCGSWFQHWRKSDPKLENSWYQQIVGKVIPSWFAEETHRDPKPRLIRVSMKEVLRPLRTDPPWSRWSRIFIAQGTSPCRPPFSTAFCRAKACCLAKLGRPCGMPGELGSPRGASGLPARNLPARCTPCTPRSMSPSRSPPSPPSPPSPLGPPGVALMMHWWPRSGGAEGAYVFNKNHPQICRYFSLKQKMEKHHFRCFFQC